jgi:hypothetical protein
MPDELIALILEQETDMALNPMPRIVDEPRVRKCRVITLADIHTAPIAYAMAWETYNSGGILNG